jgi:hypothetical protein
MKAVLPISILSFTTNAIIAIWPGHMWLRMFGFANAFYCLNMIAIAIRLNKKQERQKMIDDFIPDNEIVK